MKFKILSALMTILLFVAHANIALATSTTAYQPKAPESLLR